MWDNEGTKLLREVILPRLDAHEAELAELRAVTWPICQGLWDDKMPFRNIQQKRKFLKWLDMDEVKKLLRLKARWCRIHATACEEELRMITVETPPNPVA